MNILYFSCRRGRTIGASMTRTQALGAALVMTGTFVAAMDSTVVGTAMPTIIGDLGGVDRYSWVFSAYLLVATATTPIFGRLSDIFGRKRVYFFALVGFVAGSMLCGLARSIDELILYRALQGLGAGALLPTGFTMVGDLFDLKQRAKVQGFFSSVWVVAAVVGPAVGGIVTQAFDWRWVFFVNLPIGLVALALLVFGFHDRAEHRRRSVDWVGGIVFAAMAVAFLLGVNGALPVVSLAMAAILGLAFIRIEQRTKEPLIDLSLLRTRIVAVGLLMTLLTGTIQFAFLTYLPPFVQGVQGRLPIEAGLVLGTMSIGWSAGAALIGWFMMRVGLRRGVVLSGVCLLIGTAALVVLDASTPLIVLTAGSWLVGLGMGFANTPVLVAIQTSVGYARRGIATSLVQFCRTLGGAAGVSMLGAVLNGSLGPDAEEASALLSLRGQAPPAGSDVALDQVRVSLATGLHAVFVAMLGLAVVGLVIAWRLPKEMPKEAEATFAETPSPTTPATVAPVRTTPGD
jgi:EmrB/QacA subfamily drug resistance transporter